MLMGSLRVKVYKNDEVIFIIDHNILFTLQVNLEQKMKFVDTMPLTVCYGNNEK